MSVACATHAIVAVSLAFALGLSERVEVATLSGIRPTDATIQSWSWV